MVTWSAQSRLDGWSIMQQLNRRQVTVNRR
jgi:hypothetical protein